MKSGQMGWLHNFWKQWRCEHYWRPANVRFYPSKVCDYCEKQKQLSSEQFYAEFGISFEALVGRINNLVSKASGS